MHDHDHPTMLSSADYARLQGLMCTMIGSRTPLASLLRRKLSSAVISAAAGDGSEPVASGSRVRFRVNGGRNDERTLTWLPKENCGAADLSLHLPRGLALLGLRAGQWITYQTSSGRSETVAVDHVFPLAEDDPLHVDGIVDVTAPLPNRSAPLVLQ